MDTRAKLLFDRAVAVPLAWGVNLGARFLGAVLDRDHSVVPSEVQTIVVSKLVGMGSIIQCTSLLNTLRQLFPRAKIVFVTTRANRALIERLPSVDDAIYVDDKSFSRLATSTAEMVAALMKRKIDLYFDLEVYSAGASIVAAASLARNRYGFYRRSARWKRGIYTHLVYFNARMPIASIYVQLARAIGKEVEPGPLGPIVVKEEDRAALRAKGLPLAERYLVVNPNASDLLLERRWPRGHFARAIEELVAGGEQLVLVGAPNEAPYVRELYDTLSPAARAGVVDTSGKLTLYELFALIDGAACTITNDTGPMHVSIALGRPTVCLFGPGHPDHYGVHRDDVVVLYRPVACSPCVYEIDEPPCAGNNVCMQMIEPREVVEAVTRLLRDGRMSDPPSRRKLPIFTDDGGRPLGVVTRDSVPLDD